MDTAVGLVETYLRINGLIPPDPALGSLSDQADMIIGEVKEGQAQLNRAMRQPAVLQAALTRFGCCTPAEAAEAVRILLRKGHTQTHCRHNVRLVAFGSTQGGGPRHTVITLGHVVDFLRDYIRRYWDILHHTDFKDPAFGFLVLLEKAEQGLLPAGERHERLRMQAR